MTIPVALLCLLFFFFNDTATTEIYTLSLHDALPICHALGVRVRVLELPQALREHPQADAVLPADLERSEEHTSELQSRRDLVCRLLLEKKNKNRVHNILALIQHFQTRMPNTYTYIHI